MSLITRNYSKRLLSQAGFSYFGIGVTIFIASLLVLLFGPFSLFFPLCFLAFCLIGLGNINKEFKQTDKKEQKYYLIDQGSKESPAKQKKYYLIDDD
jgi:hypothetical protein